MNTKRFWLLRAVEGAEVGGSAPQVTANNNEGTGSSNDTGDTGETGSTEEATEGDQGGDDDGKEDPNGRGSKRAVLADLARERDKRQALEDELNKLREATKSNDEASDKVAELTTQVETLLAERHELQVKTVLNDTGLPAEMADRLRGETLDELRKDAESLAKVFNQTAGSDPTQGRGDKPQPKTMADALSAYYN